jgi:hypothetical protein
MTDPNHEQVLDAAAPLTNYFDIARCHGVVRITLFEGRGGDLFVVRGAFCATLEDIRQLRDALGRVLEAEQS